jgi:PAS domain S-box-containing protein
MHLLTDAPIKRKLTIFSMLTTFVALILACAGFVTYEMVVFHRTVVSNLQSTAEIIGSNSAAAITFDDPASAEETLGSLRAHPHVIGGAVYDDGGKVFATYTRPGSAEPFIPPPAQPDGSEFGENSIQLFRTINVVGGNVTVFIQSDLEELHDRLVQYGLIVLCVFAVASLAAFSFSTQLRGFIAGPISHLAQVVGVVAKDKNYSIRAVKRGNDELGQLMDGFNGMLEQIQSRDAALQEARASLERRVEERTQELANSLSLLNATLDSTPDAILAVDLSGHVLCSNRKLAEIWGLSDSMLERGNLSEIIGHAAAQTKNPEQYLRRIQELHARPEIKAFDIIRLKDGRTLERIVQPQMIDKKCVGRVINFRDVTESKRREEALRKSNQRFEIVTRATTNIIWDWDLQTNLIAWNENFHTVLGYPAHETGSTVEESWAKRVHPEDQAAVTKSLQDALSSAGDLWSAEYRFLRKDGSYAYIFDRGYILRGEENRPVRVIGAMQDMTERKQAEDALAEASGLLRTLMDNIPDFIYFKDLESRFVHYSAAFVHYFNLEKPDDLVGKSDFDCYSKEDATARYEDEQQIIRSGQPLIAKLEHRTNPSDGSTTWLLTSKLPWRDHSGRTIGTFGVSKDITPIKEAERKLKKVHKQLLTASRVAGMAEVATNVLHNVGNVLNSVNVSASLVADSVRNSKAAGLGRVVELLKEHESDLAEFISSDPKGRQLPVYLAQLSQHVIEEHEFVVKELESLRANIEHIKEIVSMQQNYARVFGVREVVNVVDLVEDSLRMNLGALSRHGVEIIRDFKAVSPINVDKNKVLQILVNLIRNAKYACDDSERNDKRVTLSIKEENGSVIISVADNGIGIPKANLTKIFHHGFTTRKTGHGYGLHSGALAARDLGGKLTVHSDGPGHGATFTLEIPVHAAETSQSPSENAPSYDS